MNHHLIISKGKLLELSTILKIYPNLPVFLVTGKKSYTKTSVKNQIIPLLINHSFTRFFDFSVNPKLEEVLKGIALFKKNNCKIIIAIGGGSVIDTAKAINVFVSNPNIEPKLLVQHPEYIKSVNIPFIAIPTTAGSGSEATHFAVIYSQKEKYSIAHEKILPNYTILNATLTHSMNPTLTANTGLDALCQAIESYWSVNATKESREYAIKAFHLILPNLVEVVNKPTKNNRRSMQLGAYWAGRAINISKTTAPHAFSYYLTTHHGIPHGHAVALWMPVFLEINKSKIDSVLSNILITYLSKDYIQGFKNLVTDVKLESDLRKEIDLKNINFDKMIASVNIDRLKNNPVDVQIIDIKKELY